MVVHHGWFTNDHMEVSTMRIALLVCTWIVTLVLTWYITSINVKPERVIVTQEKIIYQLKTDLQIQKIKEEEQYLIRIPFTDLGITKQFTIGFFSGAGATALLL